MTTIIDLEDWCDGLKGRACHGHFEEAVRCYKSQSYRGTIVLAWQAIVHDFTEKLTEMSAHGHNFAKEAVGKYDEALENENIPELLAFEKMLPKRAKNNAGIISRIDEQHLRALQQERHNCAHPTLHEPGETYQPTREAARLALRTAWDSMISRPSIVGRYARDVMEKWLATLGNDQYTSPLNRTPMAKADLRLIEWFIRKLFEESIADDGTEGLISVLYELREMRPDVCTKALNVVFSKVVLDNPSYASIWLEWLVESTFLFDFLNTDARLLLEEKIRESEFEDHLLTFASWTGEFRAAVEFKLRGATTSQLVEAAIDSDKASYVWSLLITRLANAKSFDEANDLLQGFQNRVSWLTESQRKELLGAVNENNQVRGAFEVHGVLHQMSDLDCAEADDAKILLATIVKEKDAAIKHDEREAV